MFSRSKEEHIDTADRNKLLHSISICLISWHDEGPKGTP